MINKRIATLLFTVSTLSWANFAEATNFWKNSVVTGNWSTGNNWSATSAAGVDNAGVPSSEAVYIAFTDGAARTVTYDSAAPSIGVLSIDLTGPGVTTATLSLPGANNLATDGIIVGGSNSVALTNGRGAFIQSGGTVMTSPGVGDVVVGYGAGSTGAYTLSGGALINNLHEYIGLAGAGTFNHSGGSNTINSSATGFLSVGHNAGSTGTYNLSGTGALLTSVRQYVGLSGTGNFNQLGGSNAPNAGLAVGDALGSIGVYAQSGGTNTLPGGEVLFLGRSNGATGTYNLSGAGALASPFELVGDLGTGTFNHSGGTNTLLSGGTMVIANNTGSTGIYNLSGTGSLMSFGHIYVGNSGAGSFNQTGGSNTISGSGRNLYVGYNGGATSGTYTLSSGDLAVKDGVQYIGYSGAGTFNHSGGTNLVTSTTVPARFSLGYTNAATGTYNLSGTGSVRADSLVAIGEAGTGIFNQSGGTFLANGTMYIAQLPGSTGTYTLTGGFARGSALEVGGASASGGTGVLTVSGGHLNILAGLKIHNTPGTSVNLSGGTLEAGGLDFSGSPTRFNWTGGKLDLNDSFTWNPLSTHPTSVAFGSSLVLGNNQALEIASETLGGTGAFSLTLNSGSAHYVHGDLIISSTGTLTQNVGSTLYAATIYQGGTVNGVLQNQGIFNYQSGQFNGRLLNQGTVNLFSLSPQFTAGNGVQNESVMAVNTGQTLIVNGAGLDNLGTFTLSGGVISGSGPVLNNYGGTLEGRGAINSALTNYGVLQVDGVLRLNGASNVNNGIVRGSGTVIGAFANAAGGTLAVGSGELLAISNGWSNSGLTTLASGALLGGGAIANTGTIEGAGTVNSPIANAGVIRASGGQLSLGAAGNTNAAAGLIQASAGNTAMVLQGLATNAGTIALTGGAFDNNNRALVNSGVINGYGVIRTSTLTNTNKLNVGEGNLDVFGAVTNNGTIGVQGGRSVYFFGAVNGAGSYTGTGTAVFLAAVSPGNSPAAVTFSGNATLASSSTLLVELGGTARGSEYDAILAAGNLTLGGSLTVSFIDAGDGLFAPTAGDSFDLLDWGSLTGSFSSISLPTLNGLRWDTSQLYSNGVLSVVAAFLEADFNESGMVNAADLVLWRSGIGTSAGATHFQGDADGDRDVDGNDFLVWQRQLGMSSPVPPATIVPEPATMLLAIVALLVMGRAGLGAA